MRYIFKGLKTFAKHCIILCCDLEHVMKLGFTMLICKMLTILWCVQYMSVPHCKTDGFKLFRHSPLIYNFILCIKTLQYRLLVGDMY